LEQRITARQRCHISGTRFQQEADLKAIRATFPEYTATHSQVLQDVLAWLDNTYRAFFRRVANPGLSKIGRIAIRWSRPLAGTPKTVTIRKEVDGW
jgi:hypothetical protein